MTWKCVRSIQPLVLRPTQSPSSASSRANRAFARLGGAAGCAAAVAARTAATNIDSSCRLVSDRGPPKGCIERSLGGRLDDPAEKPGSALHKQPQAPAVTRRERVTNLSARFAEPRRQSPEGAASSGSADAERRSGLARKGRPKATRSARPSRNAASAPTRSKPPASRPKKRNHGRRALARTAVPRPLGNGFRVASVLVGKTRHVAGHPTDERAGKRARRRRRAAPSRPRTRARRAARPDQRTDPTHLLHRPARRLCQTLWIAGKRSPFPGRRPQPACGQPGMGR